MTLEQLLLWMEQNPNLAFGGALVLSLLVFFLARIIIGRGLFAIAGHTRNRYDDIIVKSLRPFRVAWIAPLFVIWYFSYLLPEAQPFIQNAVLFVILWILVFTFNSLLNAVNDIYESGKGYSGVPIEGYLDLVKILFYAIGLILSVSLITRQSPLVLLTGLGAITAVLLLVFSDTILSLVASVQISTNDLIKEGDWIEIPSLGVDGDVVNMTLHTIKIQNFDKTISVLPTSKVMEVTYKNWRGMLESGGQRIQRAITLDINSIRFLKDEEVEQFKEIALIKDFLEKKQAELASHNQKHALDSRVLVNRRRLTNVSAFRAYVEAYLRSHPDVHQEGYSFVVRELDPGENGLPVEIYVFAKATEFAAFEAIQADIFDHLLAVVPEFGLRVFQSPTGSDFAALDDV